MSLPIPTQIKTKAHINSESQYNEMHNKSIQNPTSFWESQSNQLDWFKTHDKVFQGSFKNSDVAWFLGGKLNVSVNCIDRHDQDKVAIIWEQDEPGNSVKITYGELLRQVCRLCGVLRKYNVKRGDVVCIYLFLFLI